MRIRLGMVHGRFQPFHNGHLEYAKMALSRCEQLLIGITNPDPSMIVPEEADPQRHRPEANVFTFFERMMMIKAALIEEGVALQQIHVIPFPIHHPERWHFYFPADTVQFIRVFSRWGREKMQRLASMGLRVEVLEVGRYHNVSGSEVRRTMGSDGNWKELVPRAVARILREIDAEQRLKHLTEIPP